MKLKIFFFNLLFFFFFSAEAQTYYVDPVNGNDGNAGAISSPFKTIYKARDVVRSVSANMSSDIYVYLRGGTFYLDSTVNFYDYDSGNNGHNIIYSAYNNEQPIINGGVKITGWYLSDTANSIYAAPVDPALDFRQIYVGENRAIRAREPDLTDETTFASYYQAISAQPFTVNTSETGNWNNLNSVECVWIAYWHEKRARIASFSVNGSQTTINFTAPENSDPVLNHSNQGNIPGHYTWYYFENAYEFIDQEREWYLDKNAHILYYKPNACDAGKEVVVPRVEKLFSFTGNSVNHVHNIQFNGIIFERNNWTKPNSTGYLNWQCGMQLVPDNNSIIPGMVEMDYAEKICFEKNTFHQSGMHAIVTENFTNGNIFIGNKFSDLGGGGIYINSAAGYCGSTFDTIKSNLVEKVGRVYSDVAGIFATNDANMLIEHNEVRDCPYVGIDLGWNWDTVYMASHDNEIRFNKVHHVMQLHDDGAGIYWLGRSDNGNVHDKYISQIKKSPNYGANPFSGIYFANGSEFKTAQDNVCDSTIDAFYALNTPNLNNSIKNNFYNTNLGQISSQNYVQNNVFVNGNNWNATAQNIIGNSGIEPAYQSILYSGMIPGKVEAENYSAMYCVMTEATGDAGSGKNVGAIDQNDWMDYFVNVASAGNYTVNFRVASFVNGSQLELRIGSTVLATVNIPNTGGWQNWQTVSANVTLNAGVQTLRIISMQPSTNWNINWFDAQISTVGVQEEENNSEIKVFPNPSSGIFNVECSMLNAQRLEIYNVVGEKVYEQKILNPQSLILNLNLESGIYFLKEKSETKVARTKLIID